MAVVSVVEVRIKIEKKNSRCMVRPPKQVAVVEIKSGRCEELAVSRRFDCMCLFVWVFKKLYELIMKPGE